MRFFGDFTTPTGLILLRFISDEETVASGWSFSWSPAPITKFCTDRTVAGASGAVDDLSGGGDYGNK